MDRIEIGQFIKNLRMLKALNQKELGHRIGVSQSQISLIEKGQGITLESLEKIGLELGFSLAELFIDGVHDYESSRIVSLLKELSPEEKNVVLMLIELLSTRTKE